MDLWKSFSILYSIFFICAVILLFSCTYLVTAQNISEIIKQRQKNDLELKADVINGIKNKVEKISLGLANLSANAQVKAIEKIRSRLRAASDRKEGGKVIDIVVEGIKSQLKMKEHLAAQMEVNDEIKNKLKSVETKNAALIGHKYDDKTSAIRKKILITATTPKKTKVKLKRLEGEAIESRQPNTKTVKKSIQIDKQQAGYKNSSKIEEVKEGFRDSTTIKPTVLNDPVNVSRKTARKAMKAKDTIFRVIPNDNKDSKKGSNCGCRCQMGKICTHLKTLGTLQCDSKDGEVPLKKLCDGIYDCSDSSDELYCPRKGLEKLLVAKKVLAQAINMSTGCLDFSVQNMLLNQNEFLRQTENATNILQHDFKGVIKDRILLEHTANQVATVVSTVASEMDGGLCMDQFIDHGIEKFVLKDDNGLDDELELNDESEIPDKWFIKACRCSGGKCLILPCSDECLLVCSQTYNLQRFECQAVDGSGGIQSSVSLNKLCDGKMDCGSTTDENGCAEGNSYGKFQANLLYNDVLKMLTMKMTSNDYKSVKSTLNHLNSWVAHLQKLSTEAKVNIMAIKRAREGTFQALSTLYIHKLKEIGKVEKIKGVYDFLEGIHGLLVTALKNSHTGNERLIALSKCFCQNEECSNPHCPRTCARACAVKQRFTKAYCENNRTTNSRIPMEAVCDGKWDCIYGEDEASCKKDLCQKHHFKALAMEVDKMGSKDKGNFLGEIIQVWKTKVISNLNKIQESGRPSRNQLNAIVKEALNDLVNVYASIDETTKLVKQGTRVFDALEDIAREVMDVLRQCTL